MNDVARIEEPLNAANATIGTTHYPKGLRRLKSDLGRLADELPGAAQTLERLLLAAEIRARLLLIRAASDTTDDARTAVVTGRVTDAVVEMGVELATLGLGLRGFDGLSPESIDRLFYMEGGVKVALAHYEQQIRPLAPRADQLAHVFARVGGTPIEVLEVREGAPGELEILAFASGEGRES